MQRTRFTIRSLMVAVAIAGADLGAMFYGPPRVAATAIVVTFFLPVALCVIAIIRWGSRGPGETLY
jgi:hypothetical protein